MGSLMASSSKHVSALSPQELFDCVVLHKQSTLSSNSSEKQITSNHDYSRKENGSH